MKFTYKINPETKDITFFFSGFESDELKEAWFENLETDGYKTVEREFVEQMVEGFSFDVVEPEEYGDLTDGLIFCDGTHEWWESNYAVRSFLDDLIKDGQVTIDYARPCIHNKAILLRQWPRYYAEPYWRKPYCAIFLETNEVYSLTSNPFEWEDQSTDQVNEFKIQSIIEHSKPVRPSDKEYYELLDQIEYMWREDHNDNDFLTVYSSIKQWRKQHAG